MISRLSYIAGLLFIATQAVSAQTLRVVISEPQSPELPAADVSTWTHQLSNYLDDLATSHNLVYERFPPRVTTPPADGYLLKISFSDDGLSNGTRFVPRIELGETTTQLRRVDIEEEGSASLLAGEIWYSLRQTMASDELDSTLMVLGCFRIGPLPGNHAKRFAVFARTQLKEPLIAQWQEAQRRLDIASVNDRVARRSCDDLATRRRLTAMSDFILEGQVNSYRDDYGIDVQISVNQQHSIVGFQRTDFDEEHFNALAGFIKNRWPDVIGRW